MAPLAAGLKNLSSAVVGAGYLTTSSQPMAKAGRVSKALGASANASRALTLTQREARRPGTLEISRVSLCEAKKLSRSAPCWGLKGGFPMRLIPEDRNAQSNHGRSIDSCRASRLPIAQLATRLQTLQLRFAMWLDKPGLGGRPQARSLACAGSVVPIRLVENSPAEFGPAGP